MADQFVCRLALPTGEIVERVMTADTESALRRDLEAKDCLVLELRRRSAAAAAIGGILQIKPRLNSREFLFFNQEFSALLRAGLPILTSLDILIERRKNPVFRKALVDVRDRVKSGEALSDAFGAQGDLFPKLYCSSLASGERSGELPTVLKRYIDYSRKVLAIRKKVVSASIYPSVIVVAAAIVISIMVFVVIPKFNEFLTEMGTDLPVSTQILVGGAVFLRAHVVTIGAGLVAAIVAFVLWKRTPAGKIGFDRIKMRIPLAGAIMHDYAQNRFTRTLGTLVSGGIPLVTSLELASRAVGNFFFERKLLEVTNGVREGQSLWESLERTGLVSDMAVEMIKVGESTGALTEMLDSASEFSEEEIDYKLNKVITIIEPVMLVFMALVVTGVLLALYMPMIRAAGSSRF